MSEIENNSPGFFPLRKSREDFAVKFSDTPSVQQLEQIKRWLVYERENFNEGFYCNWPQIIHSFNQQLMMILVYDEMAIGFLTYRFSSNLSVTIELFEIAREYRRKGYGKLLADGFFCYLQGNSIYTVDLLSEPISSKFFWQHMGFTAFPLLQIHNNRKGYFYKILTKTKIPSFILPIGEFIMVWTCESLSKNKPADWVWEVKRLGRNSKTILPIVLPMDDQWQIQWQNNGKILYFDTIRKFKAKAVDYGNFLILCNLPIPK